MTDCGAVMDAAISQWGSLFPSAAAWTAYPPPANLPHEGRSREGSHYQLLLLTRGSERLRVCRLTTQATTCSCPLPETGILVPCTAWIGALKLLLGLLEFKQKCELAPD